MRILQIGKWYPPARGGMETVLRELATGLGSRGHEVRVLVAADGPRSREDRDAGVLVRRVARWGSLRSMPLCPGFLAALDQELERFDPEIVHLHLPNPGAGWVWLARRRSQALVVSHHSDIVRQRWLLGLWRPYERRLLAQARRIVTSSEALAQDSPVLQPHREKVEVIPFGIDPAWAELSSSESPGTRGRYFLFVGRLVYYKGLDVLLEALRGSDMRLLVAGDGPMRGRWEQRSRRLDLERQVDFLGRQEDADLKRLLREARALVLPSSEVSETFGLVQLEAMSAGRPVIAARASAGVESVTRHGETGLLVPPRDAEALRAAMSRVWQDDTLADRMGRAGAARLAERFHRDTMLDRFEALYREALPASRSTTP